MTVQLSKTTGDGCTAYSVVFGKPSAEGGTEPGMAALFAKYLGEIEGKKTSSSISEHGVGDAIRDFPQLDPPIGGSVIADVRELLKSPVPLLPNQPVGVGATWKVESKEKAIGVLCNHVRTYKLREFVDDYACIIDFDLAISPAIGNSVSHPQNSDVLSITEVLGGSGSGYYGLMFDRPLPFRAKIRTTVRSVTTLRRKGTTNSEKLKELVADTEILVRSGNLPFDGSTLK